MIQEKSYTYPVMLAYEPYLATIEYIVIGMNGVILQGDAARWQLDKTPTFIAHHGHVELRIIAPTSCHIDDAREIVITKLFDTGRKIECYTISDNMTQEEYGDCSEIPF